VLDRLGADKKHTAGKLRWVLPATTGVEIRDDVPPEIVANAAGSLLAARSPA